MPKVSQCTMIRSRRTCGVSSLASPAAPARAVSYEECRTSSMDVPQVPSQFEIPLLVKERSSLSTSSSVGSISLLRSRSRGVSTNLSLLASTDEKSMASRRRGSGHGSCPPSPSNGTWGQFIDFVIEEDHIEDDLLPTYSLHGTRFSKCRSMASFHSSLSHPYLLGLSARKIRERSNSVSKKFCLKRNYFVKEDQSPCLSPNWSLSKGNEPASFLCSSSIVSACSVLEESLLEKQLQEMRV
jgi:hypothetical protein